MNIHTDIAYAAEPLIVSAMTFDEAFQTLKCQATGALAYTVDISAAGGHTVVTTTRDMPTDSFPDFVRSLVGQRLKITEVDDWGPPAEDGARTGTVLVTVEATPIRFEGTLSLAPAPGGAAGVVSGDLKAGVPFIGGKIEQAAAPAITAAVKVEERTAADWLATHPT